MFTPPVGVSTPISQHFGENKRDYSLIGLKGHDGIDYVIPTGWPVKAVGDGTVVFMYDAQNGPISDPKAGTWNVVKIQHDGYQSTYGHLQYKQIFVKVGDKIKQGQEIAFSNNSGWSTGSHLHLSIKQIDLQGNVLNRTNGFNGAIDPLPLFTGQISHWALPYEDFLIQMGFIKLRKDLDASPSRGETYVILKNMYDSLKK